MSSTLYTNKISFFIVFSLFVLFLTLYATKKGSNNAPKVYNVVMSVVPEPYFYSNGTITWNTAEKNTIPYVLVFGATLYDLEFTSTGQEHQATFKLTVESTVTGNNNCSLSLAVIGENGMLAIAGDNSQLTQAITGISCILGNAKLLLEDGSYKQVDQLQVGDKLAQMYSHHAHGYDSLTITEVVKTFIKDYKNNILDDSRLFISEDGKLVLTFWHKILFDGKYILPIHHPAFKETFMDNDFTVYNFKLNKPGVFVTESEYVLESLS